MLRVIGQCNDRATRIENCVGESAANPYLYLASQIHAGLDGLRQQLRAPCATGAPHCETAEKLPISLSGALQALRSDAVCCQGFGHDFINVFDRIKQAEITRHVQVEDPSEWQRREYFG